MVALEHWLASHAGQYFVQREQAWLDRTVPDLFGFRAVQLGTRAVDGLRESRIPHRAYVQDIIRTAGPHEPDQARPAVADCYASFEDLPFDSQSLDLVVLPHVLEFAADPLQVLREVDRVLMPEGRVLITGFNPMSLWGLRQSLFGRWKPVWPQGCEPIHLVRLKEWLKVLSVEPEFGRFVGYRFPAFSEHGLQRMPFMEKAGDRWWPVCGGVYCFGGIKRIRGMRLVGPAFKDRKPLAVKSLKPVTHQAINKSGNNPLQ